tara:strand:+ start:511 stop:1341 length:831 start_codon:yes stop_codon:yes gene_type:complete
MKIYPLLKFVYNGLLTGLPIITYNAYTKNNFMCEFNVKPYSAYLNYKLDDYQAFKIKKIFGFEENGFEMEKISIKKNEKPNYYLSVNIYNCTLPIIPNKDVTRLEINTYVKNNDSIGTMILDYSSNQLSMDPVNIFKRSSDLRYNLTEESIFNLFNLELKDSVLQPKTSKVKHCSISSDSKNFLFKSKFSDSLEKDNIFEIDEDLIKYSDNIYYSNGVYDKLYYDSTLTFQDVFKPLLIKSVFNFYNMTFDNPESIFIFKNKISFSGSIWKNIYDI